MVDTSVPTLNNFHFLNGSSLGELIRKKDWSDTELGEIDTWPQCLRIALGIILKSQFPMFLSWGKHRTFFYNDAYAVILGKKHPTALGRPFKDVWHEIWSEIEPLVSKVDRGESLYLEDLPLRMNRHGYDEDTYFTFSYSPIHDENGGVAGLFCSVVETTKRKQSEDALHQSQQRLSLALEATRLTALELKLRSDAIENSLAGFDIVDENGKLIYANQAYLNMWGYSSVKEVIGMSPAEHCADPETPIKIITSLKQTGACDIEFLAKRKDGTTFDVRMLAFLAYDQNGREIYPTTSIDITEQKRAREAVDRALKSAEQSREQLYSFFMQAPAPMVIFTGPEHRFILANPLYEKYVGRKVTGKTLREAFTEEEVGYYIPLLDRVYQTGEPYVGKNLPLSLPDENGVPKPARIDVSYTPFRDNDGTIKGILVFVHDVTEEFNAREKAEAHARELNAAKDEAERANELKSAFLANMSHEIRTPLGAMIGFADLLRDPGLTSTERINYIDILARNGDQLSVIINDILDLSKVEAGHLVLEYTDTYPDQIGADVVSLLRVKAKEKDLALEYSFDETTPHSIVSDPTRVRQILINLVGNAIKFTQFGSVKIKSYGCKTGDGRPAICFEIADTGIGIPQSQRDKIFEMFVQADGTMTRRFGGTGLGLALSRRLAREMGGDVSILQTEEGVGTTFLVKIEDQPNRRTGRSEEHVRENIPPIAPEAQLLKGLRILVVDDAPDNQQLIWRYLTKQGALVESAENGLVGFRAALSGDFDIVLMDIQMPIMDGYTATQKLRENGYKQPIIALTAHAMTEVRKKALYVGCSDHLAKPINSKQLIQAIARLTAH